MKILLFILCIAGYSMGSITAILPRVSPRSVVSGQRSLRVTPKGDSLRTFYLSLDVEHLWIAGNHVKWETGVADRPDATSGNHTHCSAFIAAACKKLGLYVLRPPEHKQELLANAQYDWLSGPEAIADGWVPV